MIDFLIASTCVVTSGWLAYRSFKKVRDLTCRINNENVYSQVINSMPNMLFILDRKLKITDLINPNMSDLPITESWMKGGSLIDIVGKDNIDDIKKIAEKTFTTFNASEFQFSKEIGGSRKYFNGKFIYINTLKIVMISSNITEMKMSEIALEQNKKLMAEMLDTIPFPIAVKDLNDDLRYIYWNKECENLYDLPSENVIGNHDTNIFGKDVGKMKYEIDKMVAEKEEGIYDIRETINTKDGKMIDTIVKKKIISNESNKWLLSIRYKQDKI